MSCGRGAGSIYIDVTCGSEGCEALDFQICRHKCAFQIQMSIGACTVHLGLPWLTGRKFKRDFKIWGKMAGLMVFFFFVFMELHEWRAPARGMWQLGHCSSNRADVAICLCVCVFLQPGSAYGCRRARREQAQAVGNPHDVRCLTVHVAMHVLLVLV